jgi:LPXTG-motif cell wall-anchored protein
VGIINRRNAVMGWAVWKVAKRAGKKKARGVAPSVEGGKPNRSLIAVGLAAAAGAAAFLRGRRTES